MYKQVGEVAIDKDVFGFGDMMVVDFDADKKAVRLSIYEEGIFQDDATILLESTRGILTDADKWRQKCVDFAVEIDKLKERLVRENEANQTKCI